MTPAQVSKRTSRRKRKILVCVSGMSPAVITETLYALVTTQQFIPDQIHVFTTLAGKQAIQQRLLCTDGPMANFMDSYLPGQSILFDETTIHVFGGESAPELEDITTAEHNQTAANTIYTELRKLKDGNTQIHASIAGGRKTMGFYMGQAFSLVADHEDQLSHVLVSPPFENISDFFFPSKPARSHRFKEKTGDGMVEKTICSSQAQVSLADVAVLKLGSMWGNLMSDGVSQTHQAQQGDKGPPKDLNFAIRVAQAVYEPPELSVDEVRGKIRVKAMGLEIKLPPQHLLVLLTFAYLQWQCTDEEGAMLDVGCFAQLPNIPTHANQHYPSPLKSIQLNAIEGWEIGQAKIKSIHSDIKKIFLDAMGPASKWFAISKCKRGVKDDHHYQFSLPGRVIRLDLTAETIQILEALLACSNKSASHGSNSV